MSKRAARDLRFLCAGLTSPFVRITQLTVALLVSTLALSGCAGSAENLQLQQQTKMTAALDPWIGRTVADYVAERGEPTTKVNTTDHDAAFRWVFTGSGAGAVVPVGSTMVVVPPQQIQCTVVFYATTSSAHPLYKDYRIARYEWSGAC